MPSIGLSTMGGSHLEEGVQKLQQLIYELMPSTGLSTMGGLHLEEGVQKLQELIHELLPSIGLSTTAERLAPGGRCAEAAGAAPGA